MKKIEDLAEFALLNKSLNEIKGGVYEYATQQTAVAIHATGDCSDITYTTQGDNGDTTNKTCTVADCP